MAKKPGDKIKYQVNMFGHIITDYFNISYIDLDEEPLIVTCGHCLPENAILNNSEIKYTSGFDNKNEPQEIAIIADQNEKLYSNMINNKQLVIKLFTAPINTIVYNLYQGNFLKCKVLSYINFNLKPDIVSINNNWYILNTINKLEPPYYLISGCINRVINTSERIYMIKDKPEGK